MGRDTIPQSPSRVDPWWIHFFKWPVSMRTHVGPTFIGSKTTYSWKSWPTLMRRSAGTWSSMCSTTSQCMTTLSGSLALGRRTLFRGSSLRRRPKRCMRKHKQAHVGEDDPIDFFNATITQQRDLQKQRDLAGRDDGLQCKTPGKEHIYATNPWRPVRWKKPTVRLGRFGLAATSPALLGHGLGSALEAQSSPAKKLQ